MDKIRQNVYLEPDVHARLVVAAKKLVRSTPNLAAFIITEWVGGQREAIEYAILRDVWEKGRESLMSKDGCPMCMGWYALTERGHPYVHLDGCQWSALDAMMEVESE